MDGVARELGTPLAPTRPFFQSPRLFARLSTIHQAFANEATMLERESELATCLRLTLEEGCAAAPLKVGKEHRAVRLARAYLEEHFARSLSGTFSAKCSSR